MCVNCTTSRLCREGFSSGGFWPKHRSTWRTSHSSFCFWPLFRSLVAPRSIFPFSRPFFFPSWIHHSPSPVHMFGTHGRFIYRNPPSGNDTFTKDRIAHSPVKQGGEDHGGDGWGALEPSHSIFEPMSRPTKHS
jgi:hypothetical protein